MSPAIGCHDRLTVSPTRSFAVYVCLDSHLCRLNGMSCERCRLQEVLTRLAEPRYASLPNIMKAKKKPIQKLTPAELEVDLTPVLETLKVSEPPKRVGGGKVSELP